MDGTLDAEITMQGQPATVLSGFCRHILERQSTGGKFQVLVPCRHLHFCQFCWHKKQTILGDGKH